MFTIQSDKNFKKILMRFFEILNISVEISEFNDNESDICILRNDDDIPNNFMLKSKYIILNSDDSELLKKIKNSDRKIISCGLSNRATVTFSSISENNGVICFQRSFYNLFSSKITPFEMPFELCGKIIDETSVLMIITAALICGADISLLKKIYL